MKVQVELDLSELSVRELVKLGCTSGISDVWLRSYSESEDKITLEIEDVEEGEPYLVEIGQPELQKGLKLMAKKHPRHLMDFYHGNEDAITANVFLQLLSYGEVVFG